MTDLWNDLEQVQRYNCKIGLAKNSLNRRSIIYRRGSRRGGVFPKIVTRMCVLQEAFSFSRKSRQNRLCSDTFDGNNRLPRNVFRFCSFDIAVPPYNKYRLRKFLRVSPALMLEYYRKRFSKILGARVSIISFSFWESRRVKCGWQRNEMGGELAMNRVAQLFEIQFPN